jgi:hypothetical protein
MKGQIVTSEQAVQVGQALIEGLGLRVKNDRVDTIWGTKTPEGLGRLVEAIIHEKTGVQGQVKHIFD